MIETIISNNCTGGAVLHELGMEFKTPTILLQILPEEFTRFCKYLKYYMRTPLTEYTDLSERHKQMLTKMFGGIPDMPFGKVGDVMICFQHYETFSDARIKWNERKNRVDYDLLGFIFHARGPEYKTEVEKFLREEFPHSIVITENFVVPGSIALYPKEGDNAFSAVNGKLLITQAADFNMWRKLG